jgi:Tannase and feruloyl esterase
MILYRAFCISSLLGHVAMVVAQQPIVDCKALKLVTAQPDVEIHSITGIERFNVSTTGLPSMGVSSETNLNICDVTVVLSHPRLNDLVVVKVWLPLKGWNGRFLGAGGGTFYASLFDFEFGPAVARGYAAAGTDAGLFANMTEDLNRGSWVLKEKGRINLDLLTNYVSRSVHDMAVVGKAITEAFYGVKPKFSYWYGCSTGGRQGYMEAQRYPKDFNGILAIAPSLNSPSLSVGMIWPQIVMNQLNVFPLQCVFDKFVSEIISRCDKLDGVEDGIIVDPTACIFNPTEVIGANVSCNGVINTVTTEEAEVVRQILSGPRSSSGDRLWYGISPGTSFSGSAATEIRDEIVVGVPFSTAEAWLRYFLRKDPAYNPSSATFDDLEPFLRQSNLEYGEIYDTNSPDLSAFHQAGGKLLSWHGVADEIIPYEGTVRYRREMERKMRGVSLDEFYRVFFAPGVQHCGSGAGPMPTDPLSDLVAWVEQGKAPLTLHAATKSSSGTIITRNLCLYPSIWKYKGQGDVNIAESWTCTKNLTCGPICGNL